MKVSVIIPVRNEELLLDKIVEQLENKLKDLPCEIIFINDYSNDNTFLTLERLIKNKNQFKLCNNKRKGLGGAITEGINNSTGELICIMMSDLSDDIEDFKKYYSAIKNEQIDAVFGSRFIRGSKITDYPKKKLILNRIFNIVTKLLFLSDYNDFTNAFKIYRKNALLKNFSISVGKF